MHDTVKIYGYCKRKNFGFVRERNRYNMYEILPVKPIGPQLYEINRFKAMFQV